MSGSPPPFETNILPKIHQSFRCAALLGIPRIVVHPIHHIRYRGNQAMLWDWNQEYYHRILELGKECGVQIALGEHVADRPPAGLRGQRRVLYPDGVPGLSGLPPDPGPAPGVDVGHAGLAGEDPRRWLRTLGAAG